MRRASRVPSRRREQQMNTPQQAQREVRRKAAPEAKRQQALLAALAHPEDGVSAGRLRESGGRAALAIAAYRANASALADRALGAAFPTVQAMVGAEDFKPLAREFWDSHPPLCGDMGEWGDAFPAWLEAHDAFAQWPYLGDCARLDLALHRCERAADGAFDAASLSLLESTDPQRLLLRLMPGTALLVSAWPIATIHDAHRADERAGDSAFETVRVALARQSEQRGESVLVARQGWRAVVYRIDASTARWTRSLLAETDLAQALDHAGEGFDFAAWLARALTKSWLKDVAPLPD